MLNVSSFAHSNFRSTGSSVKASCLASSKPITYRKYQLLQLAYLLQNNSKRFEDALAADLGRPSLETNLCVSFPTLAPYPHSARSLDIAPALSQIKVCYSNVTKWSKPDSTPFSLTYAAMNPSIRKEPKGVVLIISPFNYPVFLSFAPLVSLAISKYESE